MIKSIEFQYEFMTEENKDEFGNYVPNYAKLVSEAPNEVMANEWLRCRDLFERLANRDEFYASHKGFAFNCVYMVKKDDGKYHIYQHPAKSVEELLHWILHMEFEVI